MTMTTKTDGGTAFPMPTGHVPNVNVHKWNRPHYGMTLRDYFAAKAMAQLIDHTAKREYIARDAYEMADAMLKEREK